MNLSLDILGRYQIGEKNRERKISKFVHFPIGSATQMKLVYISQ